MMTLALLRSSLESELLQLKSRYVEQLKGISARAIEATDSFSAPSTHVPFNLAANCQDLQETAAKIEQTEMILRSIVEHSKAVR